MDLAPYQYWTGLRLDSRNWVSNLVSGLGLSMKYLDPKGNDTLLVFINIYSVMFVDIVSEDGFYIISSEKCIDEGKKINIFHIDELILTFYRCYYW